MLPLLVIPGLCEPCAPCARRKYGGARRWNNMVGGIIKRRAQTEGPVSALREDTELDKEAFRELLTSIDRGLRALPATAQVPAWLQQ